MGPRGRRLRSASIGWLLVAFTLAVSAAACAQGGGPRVLRVATSGDYAPFSIANEGSGAAGPGGLDAAVARAYAADRDLEIEWHRFRWPELLDDLAKDRFDVAMSGITVRPERSAAGLFSLPVAVSGAVALVPLGSEAARAPEWLDLPAVRIAVNAGGHLEKVSRTRFPRARITALADNAAVPAALVAGRVDAVVSDSLEAPHWLAAHPGLVALAPFTRDRKAYLMPAAAADRAADLDAWLLEKEADGSLARLRREHLGAAADASADQATPLRALLASIDERLALMPGVAEAKAVLGVPIAAPEREVAVIAAAVAGAREAACPLDLPAALPRHSDAAAIESLFVAQIEAAKAIQQSHLAQRPPTTPDDRARAAARRALDSELRPALLRIGARMTRLVACLDGALDAAEVQAATRTELAARELPEERLRAIADAIVTAAAAHAQ